MSKETCLTQQFCYHCVENTMNDVINAVERNLSGFKGENRFFPVVSKSDILFAPSHRRCRSDDSLVHGDPGRFISRQNGHFLNVSRTNGNKLLEETIVQSLKQAEELKQFIAEREYETNVELERENAHFLLSELLISTIEQMKWRNVLSNSSSRQFYVVPPQKSRLNSVVAALSSSTLNDENVASSVVSDELNRTLGDYTAEDSLSGSFSETKPASSSSVDENLDAGYASSVRSQNPLELDDNSAELVAINLLQNFSKKHFPRVNNNAQYLVSYKDAPQLLLPMPSSTAVAPDDLYVDGFSSKVNIRGTFDWAPPRPQLIFTLNTPQKLRILLQNQANRCPGCGRKIDPNYYKRLRYCAYLGKAFCQCCHRGETALVPAHILHRWNFKRYPVSDFAYRFLSTTYETPYYNVSDVNKQLYSTVKALKSARDKRRQLIFTYDYIRTCRDAKNVVTKDGKLLELFEKLPSHYVKDENLYSIKDFVMIYDAAYERSFENAIKWSKFHIESCEWCSAKGFCCELCSNGEILFPFKTDFVRRCDSCGSCFHKKCAKKNFDCPKCRRISARKSALANREKDDG